MYVIRRVTSLGCGSVQPFARERDGAGHRIRQDLPFRARVTAGWPGAMVVLEVPTLIFLELMVEGVRSALSPSSSS
jgi:hypothetical protein